MNMVGLLGRLTRDPKTTNTQTGKRLCQVSIAVRREFSKDKDAADFFELEAWEKTAEIIGKWVHKGDQIAIQGRLQNNYYKDKNGVNQYAQKIIVDKIDFVGNKKDSGKSDEGFNGTPVADDDVPF